MLLRARLLRCLLLAALAAAVAPVGASRNLLTRAWADGRFVASAECLGIDGDGLVMATRFACLSNVARRPTNVSQARWDYYLSLVKAGNAAGVARFLGIPRGASRVQVKRIYDRWNKAVWKETMLGVRTPAAEQWE